MNKLFLVIFIIFNSYLSIGICNEFSKNSESKKSSNDNFDKVSEDSNVTITGLIFTSDTQKLVDDQDVYNGIVIDKTFIPDENVFIKKMSSYLHQPITIEILDQIKSEVSSFYNQRNYPFVSVLIPTGQDITFGNIKVLIIASRVGNIKVEGTKYFSSKRILDQITLKKGDVLDYSKMLKDISWVNESPFLNSCFLLEEGEKFGETDLVVKVDEKFPLRVYAGYENTGNLVAGNNRILSGFNLGNVIGKNQLNYQFMCAADLDKWQGHSASYIIPFKWRHIFKVFGAYVSIKDPNGDYHLKGRAKQLSGRYTIPIYANKIKHNVIFGYDFKRANNFLDFAQRLDFLNDIDISQFVLGYELLYKYIAFRNMNYISPGGMTKNNHTTDFTAVRPGSKSHYLYSTLSLDASVYMPRNFCYIFSSSFQLSTQKLMPCEQFILGGYYTVRGYKENESISDFGILLKNEIRTPPINLLKIRKHDIQFLAFWDFGTGFQSDKTVLFHSTEVLTSIGAGMRYNIKDNLNARFDVGFPLTKIDRKDDINSRYNTHCGVYLAF